MLIALRAVTAFTLLCLVSPVPAVAKPRVTAADPSSRAVGNAPGPDAVTARDRYELCLRYFKRANYTKALETCNRVRNFHRDDPVSVLAELAVADIYDKRGDNEQARLAYEDFVRLHPRHPSVGYAVWKIGQAWYKSSPKWAGRDQTSTRQAVNVWAGYASRFPESEYIPEVESLSAKARTRLIRKELVIADYYRTRRAWRAVRGRAGDAAERYPDTELTPVALARLAEAWHAWGYTKQAQEARDWLAGDFPDSAWLTKVDRLLASPPGTEPPEPVFVRPARVPSAGGAGGGMGVGVPGGTPGLGM